MTSSKRRADHRAIDVSVTEDAVSVTLADGRCLSVPLDWLPRLSRADAGKRQNCRLLDGGYVISWPDVAVDVSIEDVLAPERSGRSPYSIGRAQLIAEQIARMATQHVHQMAGHHANLGFWISEAVAALRTIAEYQQRFVQLRDAQLAWVKAHDTRIVAYCPICRGACEFGPETPDRPHRIPAEDLDAARDSIRRAVCRFLSRLHSAGFVSAAEARDTASLVGTSIDSEDL